ncbi:MAG: phospholipase/Carboxylesterase [Gemmatimonadetes bacterium]|nr:phospholipase/Carboxylesterase [Gemmatimonadota bacterium]
MESPAALPHLLREPTVGVDGGGRPPLLVVLHGYGGDAHALLPLAERLDGRFLAVVPQGPLPLPNAGWGWYLLGDQTPTGRVVDTAGMHASRLAILRLLEDAAAEYGADPERVFLCGHSQGAALALCVALTEPERLAGVVAMSGRVIPEVLPAAADAHRVRGLPVMLAHGTWDPVVPIAHGRSARDHLERQGARVTYREYDAEHAVPPEMVDDVNAWLAGELEGGAL